MPSIGPLEVVAVAAIALIVFGPEKLPEIARTVGRTLSNLRRMADEVRDEFKGGLDFDAEDEDETAAGPAPRRDHPNVKAMAAAAPDDAGKEASGDDRNGGPGGAEDAGDGDAESGDGEDEQEFDPNYYIHDEPSDPAAQGPPRPGEAEPARDNGPPPEQRAG